MQPLPVDLLGKSPGDQPIQFNPLPKDLKESADEILERFERSVSPFFSLYLHATYGDTLQSIE